MGEEDIISTFAIEELKQKIILYQNKVDAMKKEISELSRKKEELRTLERLEKRRTSDYLDVHQSQKASLENTDSTQNLRYAKGHKRSLTEYLRGNPQSLAIYSLDEIDQILRKGALRCGEDILERRQMIQNFETEIGYLKERIQHIQYLMI